MLPVTSTATSSELFNAWSKLLEEELGLRVDVWAVEVRLPEPSQLTSRRKCLRASTWRPAR